MPKVKLTELSLDTFMHALTYAFIPDPKMLLPIQMFNSHPMMSPLFDKQRNGMRLNAQFNVLCLEILLHPQQNLFLILIVPIKFLPVDQFIRELVFDPVITPVVEEDRMSCTGTAGLGLTERSVRHVNGVIGIS